MKTAFFAQFLTRLLTRNPVFFKYIQVFCVILGGVSRTIEEIQKTGVVLPHYLQVIGAGAVQVVSITAIIMAQLPYQDPAPKVKTDPIP